MKRAENEKLTLERQLLHGQKLESLGVLAGGIAHDFNNLLAVIMGNAEMAMRDLPAESSIRGNLRGVVKAAERAADLARQMLAYSGKGSFVLAPTNLCELVTDMAELLSISISKRVVLRYDFPGDLPAVEVDATQIRQVVMNLITNASDAIGNESGVIRISAERVDFDPDSLADSTRYQQLRAGSYVCLEVVDNGCGMDESTQSRVFEPFFTTKFTGRGLGMSAVQGIVNGHHGCLEIFSEVGRGTTCRLLLPSTDQSATSSVSKTVVPINRESSPTILVIDDEEAIRSLVKQILEHFGYSVLLAADGSAGLESFKQFGDSIKAVLLDLTMPELDGVETFNELRRMSPDIQVVLMSGYSERDAVDRFAGDGPAAFVQKPFAPAELSAVFHRLFALSGAQG